MIFLCRSNLAVSIASDRPDGILSKNFPRREFQVLRYQQKTVMLSKRFSGMHWQESLTFSLCSCLIVWGVGMMKRLL